MVAVGEKYAVVVIGAGHAGCEAALAAARRGEPTLCLTISLDSVAAMPCNPAIGGPAKSHIVREIDALGGEMARVADAACIQMRLLNRSKGPAVHALRAQTDKNTYQRTMKRTLEKQGNLVLQQGMVDSLVYSRERAEWEISLEDGRLYRAAAVIAACGTYLGSRIVIGPTSFASGPGGQRAAQKLTGALRGLGIELRRFKTGTPARVDGNSLEYSRMTSQPGDSDCYNFSFGNCRPVNNLVQCWLTYTTAQTHAIIRANLHRSPLYCGSITGVGPRYCPSIEDKVVRFADKDRHQTFIEPEGLDTCEMYVQGMSTSLPVDVQEQFLRTVPGLEGAIIMRPGYAIEYDCIDPCQLMPSLMHKRWPGLFFAGQVNGTSGYEEAAGQGLMAGINAVNYLRRQPAVILRRSQAYIGVLIDDLVTKGTSEPYRMMTSRAEYRLCLRQDNADSRLTPLGRELGLVDDENYGRYCRRQSRLQWLRDELNRRKTDHTCRHLPYIGQEDMGKSWAEILRRPSCKIDDFRELCREEGEFSREDWQSVESEIKYAGYIDKQRQQIAQAAQLEDRLLPEDYDYRQCPGLSLEAREKLERIRPLNFGQAGRISGVSPADLTALMIDFKRRGRW
ncbi:MAG: tRNA uridine-5-carboxymethylaminomethyl(34) synthesis enzyme MnmG [Negativicutes bacterium]|nr:tRNA uridine-5-carboxymethylaminomethyl(34) synthesis enzyme MnmG [Negativicutes bacterium]